MTIFPPASGSSLRVLIDDLHPDDVDLDLFHEGAGHPRDPFLDEHTATRAGVR